jgi:hypothetical protein
VEGIFAGMRAAVLASLDLVDEARAAFASARGLLAVHPFFLAVITLHEGHLDLAEARDARAAGAIDRAAALEGAAADRLITAESTQDGTPPLTRRSDDARIAARILRRAL